MIACTPSGARYGRSLPHAHPEQELSVHDVARGSSDVSGNHRSLSADGSQDRDCCHDQQAHASSPCSSALSDVWPLRFSSIDEG